MPFFPYSWLESLPRLRARSACTACHPHPIDHEPGRDDERPLGPDSRPTTALLRRRSHRTGAIKSGLVFLSLAIGLQPAWTETPKPVLDGLTGKIGKAFWSPPEKRLVRATTYKKNEKGSDENTAKGKSDEKIALQYASKDNAGTLAVPIWLPRGSMVKIHTTDGVLSFIAADQGSGVDGRSAAKTGGKTEEEKAAAVLDFCAEKQLWPDFVIVDIYYYAGKVPFSDLSLDDQKALFAYAMDYVTKHE